MVRIDLSADGAEIGFRLTKGAFADAFVRRFPDAKVSDRKNATHFKVATNDPTGLEQGVVVLDWLAKRIRRGESGTE